jgi:phosphonate metabolism protein (transferase hexapeptide repeat family)
VAERSRGSDDGGIVSDLTFVEDHPAAGEPPQPPLGEQPSIHSTASVRASRLGPWTAVGPRSQLTEVTFGAFSYVVNDSDIIYAEVGKFCSIAAAVRINPGNHPMWRASQHHFVYRAASYRLGDDESDFFDWRRRHKVIIGHDVWIGHGAIVMPGVTVGTGAVIGAGAVVTKPVAPYTVVAGAPARRLRDRFDASIVDALLELAWWNWSVEQLRAALPDFRSLSVEAFVAKYGRQVGKLQS